jgi:hypothetical protein
MPKTLTYDSQGNKSLISTDVAVYVSVVLAKKGADEKHLYRFVNGKQDKEFKPKSSIGQYKKRLCSIAHFYTPTRDCRLHVVANPAKVNQIQAKFFALEIAALHGYKAEDFEETKTLVSTEPIKQAATKNIDLALESVNFLADQLTGLKQNKTNLNTAKQIKEIRLIYRLLAPTIESL